MSQPRLLFVSSYTELGGGETATLALAQHLTAFEPLLLVPREGAFAQRWRTHGFHAETWAWRGVSTWFVPNLWERLPLHQHVLDLIRAQRIECIHSDYHSLPMVARAARLAGIPVFWTCMGWWFKPRAWQRDFFRSFALTFAHSHAIKEGFLGNPPFMPPERVQVLYPGVDATRFHPQVDRLTIRQQIGLDATTPLVGMVARFQSVKGHDLFLPIARAVLDEHPHAHFVLAGENTQTAHDSAYKRGILQQIEQDPRLRTRVHVLGHRDDVERVIGACEVVVCPSRFESFGMVNVEAMACGKPIVSTHHGAPREVVVEGQTGYLVSPFETARFAGRVSTLLADADLRAQMGYNGRGRVLQHFEAQAVARQFETQLRA